MKCLRQTPAYDTLEAATAGIVFASCSVKLHRLGNDCFNAHIARFKGKDREKSKQGRTYTIKRRFHLKTYPAMHQGYNFEKHIPGYVCQDDGVYKGTLDEGDA